MELLRDQLWRRSIRGQITDDVSALEYLEDVGFALALSGSVGGLPSMWVAACGERDPAFPTHTHHDPYVGLCWGLKDTLVAEKRAFYGQLLRGKPSFVSLSWLSTLLAAHDSPKLSANASKAADALRSSCPLTTNELREHAGLLDRKTTTAALGEVQQALVGVKVEERAKPFTFVWDSVDVAWPDRLFRMLKA